MGVIVLVYFNKIISLPAPLLYYVFDRSVLLHKIPIIYRLFLHAFSVFDRDLSVIYTPNGTRILQTRSESQRKNGWEITFRLSPAARKITGTRELPYLEVGESRRLKLFKFGIEIQFSGFPLRQTVVTNVSRLLAEIKIRLFKASVQFLCTAVDRFHF